MSDENNEISSSTAINDISQNVDNVQDFDVEIPNPETGSAPNHSFNPAEGLKPAINIRKRKYTKSEKWLKSRNSDPRGSAEPPKNEKTVFQNQKPPITPSETPEEYTETIDIPVEVIRDSVRMVVDTVAIFRPREVRHIWTIEDAEIKPIERPLKKYLEEKLPIWLKDNLELTLLIYGAAKIFGSRIIEERKLSK